MLPLLHTPSFVVSKLQSGADLMTPGLANGPPFPSGAKKNAVVAIASLESPSVPVAVGVCEIDVSSLQQVQGAKGHAVRTVHWAGDELWGWSASGKPGATSPEAIDAWLEDDDVEEQLQDLKLEDDTQDGGVDLGTAGNSKADSPQAANENDGTDDDVVEKELTTKGTRGARIWSSC